MQLVKTNSSIDTYRTKITLQNDFHNRSSSTSVGSSLREEFVNIQKYSRMQPSFFTLYSEVTINMTYPFVRIRY